MSKDYEKAMIILKNFLQRESEEAKLVQERLYKCPAEAPEYEEFLFESSKLEAICDALDFIYNRIEEKVRYGEES